MTSKRSRDRSKYGEEFKMMAVKLYRSGQSVKELSSTYGVSTATIYKWIEKYSSNETVINTTTDSIEWKQMQTEMARLKEATESLKEVLETFGDVKKKRSRYLNEEELERIGVKSYDYVETWEDAMEAFLKNGELRGLREATLFYYEKEMRMIFRYLNEQNLGNVPLYKFTVRMVEDNIILYMKNVKKLSASTINIRLRAFRTVVKWLYEREMIPVYLMEGIKLLKDRTKELATFTPEQLSRFFKLIDKTTWTGVRNYAICTVLLECGLRQNELLNLEVTDVLWEENTILVKHTKTYRMRKVPITEETKTAIKRWLNVRGESFTNQLFCNISGEPLTQRGIYQMIARYGKEAKIENVRVSPHTFRHTCAKLYLKNGGDLFSLQNILGHTDIAMTRRYVQFMYEDVAKLHKQYSPLKAVKL